MHKLKLILLALDIYIFFFCTESLISVFLGWGKNYVTKILSGTEFCLRMRRVTEGMGKPLQTGMEPPHGCQWMVKVVVLRRREQHEQKLQEALF